MGQGTEASITHRPPSSAVRGSCRQWQEGANPPLSWLCPESSAQGPATQATPPPTSCHSPCQFSSFLLLPHLTSCRPLPFTPSPSPSLPSPPTTPTSRSPLVPPSLLSPFVSFSPPLSLSLLSAFLSRSSRCFSKVGEPQGQPLGTSTTLQATQILLKSHDDCYQPASYC